MAQKLTSEEIVELKILWEKAKRTNIYPIAAMRSWSDDHLDALIASAQESLELKANLESAEKTIKIWQTINDSNLAHRARLQSSLTELVVAIDDVLEGKPLEAVVIEGPKWLRLRSVLSTLGSSQGLVSPQKAVLNSLTPEEKLEQTQKWLELQATVFLDSWSLLKDGGYYESLNIRQLALGLQKHLTELSPQGGTYTAALLRSQCEESSKSLAEFLDSWDMFLEDNKANKSRFSAAEKRLRIALTAMSPLARQAQEQGKSLNDLLLANGGKKLDELSESVWGIGK